MTNYIAFDIEILIRKVRKVCIVLKYIRTVVVRSFCFIQYVLSQNYKTFFSIIFLLISLYQKNVILIEFFL